MISESEFDQINLMYKGFCGWALVKYDRLLLHGIPDIGALKYGDKVFTFSSIQVRGIWSQRRSRRTVLFLPYWGSVTLSDSTLEF